MRISAAAQQLGTSPRMLRYREILGLLPPVREPATRWRAAGRQRPARGPAHRQFSRDDLAAVALGMDIERRLDISPAELAFGLRVLSDPRVRAEVAELGRRIGRIPAPPGQALDFEKQRALRLLNMTRRPRAAEPRPQPARPSGPGHPSRPSSHTGTTPGGSVPYGHARD
jgi:MerR family transcriptional regulator, copper efflux regulator